MNRRVPQGDILYKELWLCTVGHGQTLLLQGMILPYRYSVMYMDNGFSLHRSHCPWLFQLPLNVARLLPLCQFIGLLVSSPPSNFACW
jgi:hypothetical protein